jgi:hypothetical protein
MDEKRASETNGNRSRFLDALIQKGELQARAYRRALGLLELDRGKTFKEVAKTLQVIIPSVSNWAKKYRARGWQVLQDRPREGRPLAVFDPGGSFENQYTLCKGAVRQSKIQGNLVSNVLRVEGKEPEDDV